MRQQLSDEPLQGGETAATAAGPYGQRARVTPERLAVVIKEQWKTFNQVCALRLWFGSGMGAHGRGILAVSDGDGSTAESRRMEEGHSCSEHSIEVEGGSPLLLGARVLLQMTASSRFQENKPQATIDDFLVPPPALPHLTRRLPHRCHRRPSRVLACSYSHGRDEQQLAGHAAVAHEQTEALRQQYKQQFKADPDPFEAAERQERAAERRLLLKQMRARAPPQVVAAPAPAPLAAAAAPAPAASVFGAAPAPAAGGLFGSTPAPAPTATGFSFGAPAAAPAPSTTGFGFGTAAAAPAPAATGTDRIAFDCDGKYYQWSLD